MEILMEDLTASLAEEQQMEIHDLLEFASTYFELPTNTEMSVTFMTNEKIQAYNREYRERDVSTDVISFAMEDEQDLSPELMEDLGIPRNIGDILISIDKTREQAEEYGHSFERELGFLAVHGFLHLNGYDHMTPDEEKEMFDLQRKILDDYGLERK